MKLPKIFCKHGNEYRQIDRRGMVAIYGLYRGGVLRDYDVVIIQNRAACFLGGRFIPAKEAYPSASQWGIFGWTYLAAEKGKAFAHFETCDKQLNKPRRVIRRIVRKAK
jgi:hypothetical protein